MLSWLSRMLGLAGPGAAITQVGSWLGPAEMRVPAQADPRMLLAGSK